MSGVQKHNNAQTAPKRKGQSQSCEGERIRRKRKIDTVNEVYLCPFRLRSLHSSARL